MLKVYIILLPFKGIFYEQINIYLLYIKFNKINAREKEDYSQKCNFSYIKFI